MSTHGFMRSLEALPRMAFIIEAHIDNKIASTTALIRLANIF
jgi:hypothetical protein